MLDCLKTNWFTTLVIPCFSIALLTLCSIAALSRRWKQRFRWLCVFVICSAGITSAGYCLFLLAGTSGTLQPLACRIYPGFYAIAGGFHELLLVAFACELLYRAAGMKLGYIWLALGLGGMWLIFMLLVLAVDPQLKALRHGWRPINTAIFVTATWFLSVFLPIAMFGCRRVLAVSRPTVLVLSALLVDQWVGVIVQERGLAERPPYELSRSLVFLCFVATLYRVLRGGPERLMPATAAYNVTAGGN